MAGRRAILRRSEALPTGRITKDAQHTPVSIFDAYDRSRPHAAGLRVRR